MADLWERLQAAKSRPPAEPACMPVVAAPEPAPPGWVWETRLVARRTLEFTLDPGFWRAVGEGLDPTEWERVLCFDTETTGLSGGAGTLPFLIGWAELTGAVGPTSPPGVRLTQWFLRDHPGEPDLIHLVEDRWTQARSVVSFNGASYDLPLMRSRWSLAGRVLPEVPHRDDLHPARRLWKRLLDSCRLSRLEESVLGIHRIDDVPGAQVPELWFSYLRAGAAADFVTPLGGVLNHHAQDVYSLLCLDLLLGALVRSPSSPRWQETRGSFPDRPHLARPAPGGLLHPDMGKTTPVDFWGLLALREEPEALLSLESAWADRDEAVGLAWAGRLKRQAHPDAKQVWTQLWESKRSYPALEELLKWLEHRDRTAESLTEALRLAEEGLKAPFLPRLWKEGLEKRRDRLTRKTQP